MNGKDFLTDATALLDQYRASVRADFEGIPEEKIWDRPVPGQVSPANHLLHLTGNLRHFFGHHLGGSAYERDREREFVPEPYASMTEILDGWETACRETAGVFGDLDEERLGEQAPVDHFPGGCPVSLYILRLLGHLTYHAGQIRSLYRILREEK